MSAPADNPTGVRSPSRAHISDRTLRNDRWWLPPLATVIGLLIFIGYATVRAFVRADYFVADYGYLSPFYSPCISTSCAEGASHFGTPLGPLPMFIPLGFLVLPFLLGFRFTCYYYRKAYYRSFWLAPPACGVAEPHSSYRGESRMPMILQNSHRYFFYAAVIVSTINTYDVVVSFHGKDGGIGFGLGNLILIGNVLLLWAYTLSCHSCRHVFGGRLKHFSRHPVRYRLWTIISKMNTRHMQLAWITLGTLIITDLYIMLVSMNAFADPRFFN